MAATCKQLKDAVAMVQETVGVIREGKLAGQTAKVQLWDGKYGRRFVVIRWQDGSKYCKRFSGSRYALAENFYTINVHELI